MRKYFTLVLLLLVCVVAVGCGKEKEESDKSDSNSNDKVVTTCTLNNTYDNGSIIDATYKVTSKDDVVLLVESTEKITSDDSSYLSAVQLQTQTLYSRFDNLDHYDYDVSVNGNTLISSTKIDYEHMDIDKFLEVNPDGASLFTDGKIKLATVKSMYVLMGATCN